MNSAEDIIDALLSMADKSHAQILQRFFKTMSSIMLSYTCEQMPIDERHHWQQLRKS